MVGKNQRAFKEKLMCHLNCAKRLGSGWNVCGINSPLWIKYCHSCRGGSVGRHTWVTVVCRSCCPLCAASLLKVLTLCQSSKNWGTSLQTPLELEEDNQGPWQEKPHFAWPGCPSPFHPLGWKSPNVGSKGSSCGIAGWLFHLWNQQQALATCLDKLSYLQSIIPLDSVIAFPGSHVSHTL